MKWGEKTVSPTTPFAAFMKPRPIELDAGLVRLFLLKVGGEALGAMLALERGKAFHVIMSTFEGGVWKSCSLGNVLMLASVEHCIAEGFDFFDLTIGDEGYKQHFGAAPSPLFCGLRPLIPFGAAIAPAVAFGFALGKRLARWAQRLKPRTADRHSAE